MHWTTERAKNNFIDFDNRYTLILRGRGPEQENIHFKKLFEYINILKNTDLSPEFFTEKPRIALIPQEDRFQIMYYPNNGKYWVIGYIVDGYFGQF